MPKLRSFTFLPKPDDPQILDTLCNGIRQGHPLATAATNAGIGEMTARDWLARGEQGLAEYQGGELGSHALFAWRLKQAQADFVSGNLRVVNKNKRGEKGWLPAMTLLERRMPRDFGRRTEVAVEQRSVTVHLSGQLSEATVAKVLAVVAEEHLALGTADNCGVVEAEATELPDTKPLAE